MNAPLKSSLVILIYYLLNLCLWFIPVNSWACGNVLSDASIPAEQLGICTGGHFDVMDCQQSCTRSTQCHHIYCGGVCEGGENHNNSCFFDEMCPNGSCVEQCYETGYCIKDGVELLATLARFSVTSVGNRLQVAWETLSEVDNQAMNVYCGQMTAGQFDNIIQLNKRPIASKARLPFSGSQYTATSEPLAPGVYYCALEDIDTTGQCNTHCQHLAAATIGQPEQPLDLAAAQKLCQSNIDAQRQQLGNTGSCIHSID
ncbi:MAG: hypothetical protein SVR94_10205 [Pseudomonadota bacterium]|nr:hypothetical protein [Pseudomonadota bacterium]